MSRVRVLMLMFPTLVRSEAIAGAVGGTMIPAGWGPSLSLAVTITCTTEFNCAFTNEPTGLNTSVGGMFPGIGAFVGVAVAVGVGVEVEVGVAVAGGRGTGVSVAGGGGTGVFVGV